MFRKLNFLLREINFSLSQICVQITQLNTSLYIVEIKYEDSVKRSFPLCSLNLVNEFIDSNIGSSEEKPISIHITKVCDDGR